MLSTEPYCSRGLRCDSPATAADCSVARSARQLSSSCCRRFRPSSASVSPRCTPVACQMVFRCVAVPADFCSLSSSASSSRPSRSNSSRLAASRPSTWASRGVEWGMLARAHGSTGSAGGTSCCHCGLAVGGAPPESAEPPRPEAWRHRRPGWWAAAPPSRPRRSQHAGAPGGPALGWRPSSPSSGSGTAHPQRAPRDGWRPRLSASPWGQPARCAPDPRCRTPCRGGPGPRASSTRSLPPRGRRRAAQAPPRPGQVEDTGDCRLSLRRVCGDCLLVRGW